MTLKAKIESDHRAALKSGDQARRDVLSMLKARILEAEVERRAKKGRDYQLDDSEVTEVLASYAKQRRQSIEAYQEGGRSDLVTKEKAELEVVEGYLPQQMGDSEITARVQAVIDEVGAQSARDLGKVMGRAMSELKGVADGNRVRQIAMKLLTDSD